MSEEISFQPQKSKIPIASIFLFIYAALHFISTVANAVSYISLSFTSSRLYYLIPPINVAVTTLAVIALAILVLCKVRGPWLAIPLAFLTIGANISIIGWFFNIFELILNDASYFEYFFEDFGGFISNIFNGLANAFLPTVGLLLMLIAAFLSDKKRKPVLAIIATVIFSLDFIITIGKAFFNTIMNGSFFPYSVIWVIASIVYIIAMLMFGLWMAHGKEKKEAPVENSFSADAPPVF